VGHHGVVATTRSTVFDNLIGSRLNRIVVRIGCGAIVSGGRPGRRVRAAMVARAGLFGAGPSVGVKIALV